MKVNFSKAGEKLKKLMPHKIKRIVQKAQIKKLREAREKRIKIFSKSRREEHLTKFNTAKQEAYLKLGRRFVKKFVPRTVAKKNGREYVLECSDYGNWESARQLQIVCNEDSNAFTGTMLQKSNNTKVGHVSIGFTKNDLIIEGIQ
jgi:hypothetical protein